MKPLSTTFVQTIPNLQASDAAFYPSLGAEPEPSSPTKPMKSYAVLPHSTWGRTSTFTIQPTATASDGAAKLTWTVHIHRANHGFGASEVSLRHPTLASEILASCRLKGFANHKYLHLGNPDCTALEDWIRVHASATFDPSAFTFSFRGEAWCWKRTHRVEYGAKKWNGKSFKFVRVRDGRVVAVYVHLGKWKRRDEARVDWFEGVEWEVEMLGLVAVMGVEEEIRRSE